MKTSANTYEKNPVSTTDFRYLLFVFFLSVENLPAQSSGLSRDAFIDTYPDTWSLRVYSIVKAQGIFLSNDEQDARLRYFPDDVFGLGVGFSYKFLVLDLGFTLKGDRGITNRLDLQFNLFLKRSIVNLYFQAYQGFELLQPDAPMPDQQLRRDIRTLAFGLNYYYSFQGDKMAARVMTNGERRHAVGWFLDSRRIQHFLFSEGRFQPGV